MLGDGQGVENRLGRQPEKFGTATIILIYVDEDSDVK